MSPYICSVQKHRVTKRAWCLHFLRSVLITCLLTSSLEKEIIVLKKKSENSPEFWIQISVGTLMLVVKVLMVEFVE